MNYRREIHFMLHDYASRKAKEDWMSRFLAIHEKIGSRYYVDTLRHLIASYEDMGTKSTVIVEEGLD